MSAEFAGTLRERVTLLRRSEGRDALGAASDDWEEIAALWAAIVPDGAGRAVIGDAADAAPRWRVTLRRRELRIGDRFAWGERLIAVRAIREDPRSPDRLEVEAEQIR